MVTTESLHAQRGVSHLSKRVGQTVTLFRNFPQVFLTLAGNSTRWRRDEVTYRMRNGYTVVTPNADGARFPLYEVFADDGYRLDELCAPLDADAAVLDIGGQIGSFALAVARQMPRGRVHVHEASPTSASYISRNVAANGLEDQITVNAQAMAGEQGTFTFVDSGTASGHNGLTAPDGLGEEVTVPADTFDAAVAAARADGREVQLVKIDVEGAEYEIIGASDPASWSQVRSMVMEYHPVEGHHLDELLTFLAAVGLEPVRHDRGTREGLGVMWLARPAA